MTIEGGTISGEPYGVDIVDSTAIINGGTISGTGTDGIGVSISSYRGTASVTINGGTITGTKCDLFNSGDNTITLGLGEDGVGATFPGGLFLVNEEGIENTLTLDTILAEGVAYWQGDKMIFLTDGQMEIADGDVTVKAECKHEDATYPTESITETQHKITCSCGYEVTEDHEFDAETGKCVCGAEQVQIGKVTVSDWDSPEEGVSGTAVPSLLAIETGDGTLTGYMASIGLYVTNTDEKYVADHEAYRYNEGWSFIKSDKDASQMLWGGENFNYIAYSPYYMWESSATYLYDMSTFSVPTDGDYVGGWIVDGVTYKDITSVSGSQYDLLWGKGTSTDDSATLPPELQHALTMLVVNVTGYGTDISEGVTVTGVTIGGTVVTGTLNLTGATSASEVVTVKSGKTATDIKAANFGTTGVYEALIIPQTAEITVTFTLSDGSEYETTLESQEWASGTKYTLDLQVGCEHEYEYTAIEGGTTHKKYCTICEKVVAETEGHSIDNTTGKCVCGLDMAVATLTVGENVTYYATADTAFAAAKEAGAGTVTILKDCTVTESYAFYNSNVHLTVNQGVTLTLGDTLHLSGTLSNSGTISGNGNIYSFGTIEGSGTFEGTTNNNGSITGGTFNNVVMNDQSSTISSGIFNGAVENKSGCTIDGGTFNSSITNSGTIDNTTSATAFTLGENFSITNSGTINCSYHFWKDGTCRLCGKACDHSGNKNTYTTTDDEHSFTCSVCEKEVSGEHNPKYSASGATITASCTVCEKELGTVTISADGKTYDGEAVAATVKGEGKLADTSGIVISYAVTGGESLGSEAPKDAGTYTASFTLDDQTTASVDFTIDKADIANTTASVNDTNTYNYTGSAITPDVTVMMGSTTLVKDTDYTVSYSDNINAGTATVTVTGEGNYSGTNTVTFEIEDHMAPTATITIKENSWTAFLNWVTFGYFFKDTVDVTITADGTGSDVDKVEYYLSDTALAADTLPDTGWTEVTASNGNYKFSITEPQKAAVYVWVTDGEGNSIVINSDGIVVYADSSISPTEITYTYKENTAKTVTITLNGNTFAKLADNEGKEISTDYYSFSSEEGATSGTLTLNASYLDTFDKGEYTYTIYMNPQGVETELVTLTYTFTVKVEAKELTITGATATSRVYDGTNQVVITGVTLNGVAGADDVSVNLEGVKGTVDSSNAGTYTSVTLPELTLTGTDAGNYTLVQPEAAVQTSVTIDKADATITVGTSSYDKTYGDADFALDVTDNNLEADVTYISSNENVATVAGGTVTIKGAGTATITVSLAASTNYNAAENKTITITVAKATYEVAEINKSYLYSRENADSINLAALLPTDCGTVSYGTPATTGNVTFSETPSVTDGVLSYKVASGTVGNSGTITLVVATQNYKDITITVNVSLIDQIPVSVKDGETVSLNNDTLTYGEALSKLTFKTVTFVDDSGKAVEGTLEWKEPSLTPDARTTSATWVFTPYNEEYQTIEGTVAITVNKATPTVSAVPTVAERVYHPTTTLLDTDLTGGTVSVEGTWSWQTSGIVPVVNNSGYVAVFTPTDSNNYNTITRTIIVPVTKATPAVVTAPAATAITYGDALSASSLSGTAQYSSENNTTVDGSFAWKDSSAKPTVADSDTTAYAVIFTPADSANYNTVETTATLTVNKAENAPNMPGSTISAPYTNETVGAVTLPEGWAWQDSDKETALTVGVTESATAVYVGSDKGNYENETVVISLTRSECKHPNEEVRDDKEATCGEAGYTGDTYCKDCGEQIKTGEAIEKKAHSFGEPEFNWSEDGKTCTVTFTCKNDATHTDIQDATVTSEIKTAATCKNKGVTTYTASYSDGSDTYTDTKDVADIAVDTANHAGETEVKNDKEATCGEAGYTGDTYCKDCGKQIKIGETIEKKAHSFGEPEFNWSEDGKTCMVTFTCKNDATHTDTQDATVTSEIKTAATCKNKGVTTYTASYNDGSDTYTDTKDVADIAVDAANHAGETEVKNDKEAGCTVDGYTGDTYCKDCGEQTVSGSTITALGHDYTSKVTKEPTTTEEGERTYTCTRCGDSYTEAIPKLPTQSHEHNYTAQVTKEPTATEPGVRTYTCSCGDSYTETIPATGGSTTEGNKTDDDGADEEIPAKGTVLQDTVTKARYKVVSGEEDKPEVIYVGTIDKKATTIKIPKTVEIDDIEYAVTAIADGAFKNNKKITKVEIADGVITIGKSAFYNCTSLKTVKIGNSVKVIGDKAFYGCKKLTSLTMGANVTTIGNSAFQNCTALKKVTIPKKVTKIGKKAFYGCKKLTSITIKTTKLTTKKVGSKAFSKAGSSNYKKLTVKVPKSKLKSYKTMLRKRGLSSKAKIKK